MPDRYLLPFRCLIPLLLICAGGAASADDDHERARKALEAGEVLPLGVILGKLEREHPGKVVEVELERDHGRWIYEIKLLRSGGALVKFKLDARDGSVVERKPRHGERH